MAKIIIRATKLFEFAILLLQSVRCQSNKDERNLFGSIVGMEFLLETESQLLSAMENYVNKLEHKLTIIRGAIAEMRTDNLKSQTDPEEYLSNPINSFALIRRLHQDWPNWELFLSGLIDADEINKITQLANIPTSVDLMEGSEAIYRLNVIYDINPVDMAAGLINGKQYDAHFSAIDCFSIGYGMFMKGLYYHSEIWLNTSMQLYQDSDIHAVLKFDKIQIFELYTVVLFNQDRLIEALDNINVALNSSPYNAKLLRMKSEIEFKISTSTETVAETTEQDPGNAMLNAMVDFFVAQASEMKRDCIQYTYQSKLHCLYNKTTMAFLKLAPLKMEILHLDPYVILYHDVISDAEIAALKNEAGNKLLRAEIFDFYKNDNVVSNHRTAKGHDIIRPTNIIKRLEQRVADMSGFDLRDSEGMQILNYGMGGHYQSHYDFFNSTEVPFFSEEGDRGATALFYLSDVDQGGLTVFPRLQIGVVPKKGTALVWYNLNNKGEADARTRHGSCPVIVGSKWVLTKWIGQDNQMFRRRCFP